MSEGPYRTAAPGFEVHRFDKLEPESEIKAGALVRIKGQGGPVMTVTGWMGESLVVCTYWDFGREKWQEIECIEDALVLDEGDEG